MLSKQKKKLETANADQATAEAVQLFVDAVRGNPNPPEPPKELSLFLDCGRPNQGRPLHFVI